MTGLGGYLLWVDVFELFMGLYGFISERAC